MRGRTLTSILLLATMTSLSRAGRAEPPKEHVPLEYRVKAAYIFNFARFVNWPPLIGPERANEPIVVGVAGRDHFTATLIRSLRGLSVGDRPIVVQEVNDRNATPRLHMLFIARSKDDEVPHLLRAYRGRPTLTVSELPGFLEQGGMVRLEVNRSQVQFAVNLAAIQRAGLQVSSQMLQYARNMPE